MKRISAAHLFESIQQTLHDRGVPLNDARDVAEVLVEASLHGVDTHGVRLLPYYLDLLDHGKAKTRSRCHMAEISQAVRRLQADCALGPVAGMQATREAIAVAKRFGIGSVAVRNSNHFGSAGHYVRCMAQENCIGMAFSNADAFVAPFAGKRPFFGTNPVAIAVPADHGETYCLDMATSQTSFSQVTMRKERGEPLQPGWSLDAHGRETLDAAASAALQPLGGYKGQGLAMAVELLCTVLSGADFDHTLAHALDGKPAEHQSIGHLFICIDMRPFGEASSLRQRVGTLLKALVAEPPRSDEPVLFAGQQEAATRRERLAQGVPVPEELASKLSRAMPSLYSIFSS